MILAHEFKLKNKNQVIKFLVEKEGNIPEIILNQPLLKLQGSAQQSDYQINKNSWWYQLTNKSNH